MKFDIPTPCFFGNDNHRENIKTVKKYGFDAIEMYDWQNIDKGEMKEALDENGVKLLSVCVTDFRLNDDKCRKEWLNGLEKTIRFAEEFGVKKFISQVGYDTGEERIIQHNSIVKGLKHAADILKGSDMILMIEPLNVLYNHPGYYLPYSKEGFEILDEVGSENIKMVFDIYHQQVSEGNVLNNIKDNLHHIAHLHCAGNPGRNELQFGENDYKLIFGKIDEMGYEGYCGLEYRPLLEAEESLKEFNRIYRN